MKNSKVYTTKIKRLYSSMKRNSAKVEARTFDDPIDALVYGVICERMRRSRAKTAYKRAMSYFVDLNDLRVSRPEEICDIFGKDTPETRRAASTLIRILTAVFDEKNCITLHDLQKVGKRQAKHELEALDGITHFAVNYCLLTSLKSHAIPLNEAMVAYLRKQECVYPSASHHDIEGFLTKQIAAKDGYEFYALLRAHSESGIRSRTKKSKKKTVKKKIAKTAKKKIPKTTKKKK